MLQFPEYYSKYEKIDILLVNKKHYNFVSDCPSKRTFLELKFYSRKYQKFPLKIPTNSETWKKYNCKNNGIRYSYRIFASENPTFVGNISYQQLFPTNKLLVKQENSTITSLRCWNSRQCCYKDINRRRGSSLAEELKMAGNVDRKSGRGRGHLRRRILLSVCGASEQEKKHDRGKDRGNHAASMRLVHRHSSSISSQRIFLVAEAERTNSEAENSEKGFRTGKTTDERRGRRRDGRERRKERCLRQPLARRQGGSQLVTVTAIPLLLSSLFPRPLFPESRGRTTVD